MFGERCVETSREEFTELWFTVLREGLSFMSAVHLYRNMNRRVNENVVLREGQSR